MADTYIDRAFIPPTEYEVTDGQAHEIVWSLGSEEHPWKNVYISDYTQDPVKAVDMYAILKNVSLFPAGSKEFGMFMKVGADNDTLEWTTLKDAVRAHVSGDLLTSIIASNPVERAKADEDGLVFKNYYMKANAFNAKNIAETLGTYPVNVAVSDGIGRNIANTYVTASQVDDGYVHRASGSTSSALEAQGFAKIAWTGEWRDVQNKPSFPDSQWVKDEIDYRINAHVTNKHNPLDILVETNRVNIAALDTELSTLESNVVYKDDYATTSKAGIIKVDESNGLVLEDNYGKIGINLATNSTAGTVIIDNSNGLTITSNGIVTTTPATTSKRGTVSVDTSNGLDIDSTGHVSTTSATDTKRGTVTVDTTNGLSVNSGRITTTPATTSKYGTVKLDTSKGLAIDNTTGQLTTKLASNDDYGVVKVDSTSKLTVSEGVISVDVSSSDNYGVIKVDTTNNLTIDNGTLGIEVASADSLGVVKVDTSNGALSISSGELSLGLASDSKFGVIKVDTSHNLSISNGTLDIDLANTTTSGSTQVQKVGVVGVKNGNGLSLNNTTGVISMAEATTSTFGAVKLGRIIMGYQDYSISTIPADGQWYYFRGKLTVTESTSTVSFPYTGNGNFIVRKYNAVSIATGYVFCEAHCLSYPYLVFYSEDNGAKWCLPQTTLPEV